VFVLVSSLIILTQSSCILNSDTKEPIEDFIEAKPFIITVSLYRYSNELYLFRLKTDGTLEVLFADRYINLIDPQNEEMDIVKSDSKVLSQDQLVKLNQIVNQIQDYESNRRTVRGYWDVVVKFEDEIFRFTYGDANDKKLDELITMLIDISPFEIVNDAGLIIDPVELE
jgi:hypothetical protein